MVAAETIASSSFVNKPPAVAQETQVELWGALPAADGVAGQPCEEDPTWDGSMGSKEWPTLHEGTLLRNLTGVAVRSVSVGGAHMAFVAEGGMAFACGQNSRGQLGLGDLADRREPALISDLRRDYCDSPAHSKLVGQVGSSSSGGGVKAAEVLPPGSVWRIGAAACGSEHTLFLATRSLGSGGKGQVFACGASESIGIEACQVDQMKPQALPAPTCVTAIAARGEASCCAAAAEDGNRSSDHLLYFWGELCGADCPEYQPEPEPLFRVPAAVEALALGGMFGLALDSAGQVYAWGDGTYGELGGTEPVTPGSSLGEAAEELPEPGRVFLPRVAQDSSGGYTAGPTSQEGDLSAAPMVIGRPRPPAAEPRRPQPAVEDPARPPKVVDIACGERHSLLLDDWGRVFAFGENLAGQCGVPETVGTGHISGSVVPKPRLVPIEGPRRGGSFRHPSTSRPYEIGVHVFAGAKHSAVVTKDRHLFIWGCPANRRLGSAGQNADGSEAGESVSKERPPGVAIRSALRDSVRRPRLVFSHLHRRVTTVGLGDACSVIVTGDGIIRSSEEETSTPDEVSPLGGEQDAADIVDRRGSDSVKQTAVIV